MKRLAPPPDDDPSRDYAARWRALFAPRTGDVRLEMAEEAARYLGLPVAHVLELFDGAAERFAEEWRERRVEASDASAVAEFYNGSETELFDLLDWHATDAANHRALVCADLLTKHRAENGVPRRGHRVDEHPRVLDYGSGVGTTGIVFARAGYDVTLADVAEPLLSFAAWRFELRGLPVAAVDLKREPVPRGCYDAVVCFDVLEHIPRPLPVVRRLRNALAPRGLLFLFAPFGEDPLRPMHVVHDDRVLDWFRALGLRRRDDMEDWFPVYTWMAKPHVYERCAFPLWKRAAYLLHDVVLPQSAAEAARTVWSRVSAATRGSQV